MDRKRNRLTDRNEDLDGGRKRREYEGWRERERNRK